MACGLNFPVANSPVIRKFESGVTGITKRGCAYQFLTTFYRTPYLRWVQQDHKLYH